MASSSEEGDEGITLSIRMFHGGKLDILHTNYMGGKLTVYNYCDTSEITLEHLQNSVRAIGYKGLKSLYYREPGLAMEEGLVLIKSEEEVQNMKAHAYRNNNTIEVFVKHNTQDDMCFGEDMYERIYPDEHGYSGNGSNGVGDLSDEVDDYDFVDSEYSMSEDDDKLYSENVDVGAEWVGRARGNLGLESDGGESDNEDRDCGENSNSEDEFNSLFDDNASKVHPKAGQLFGVYKECEDPKFQVGMIFKDHVQCRDAIIQHSYREGRRISFIKSEVKRVKAVCKQPCPWFVFASLNWDKTFQMKKVGPAHTCVREQNELPLIHSGFLAKKYMAEFRINPKWPIVAFHKRVIQDIQIDFPFHVLRRAKRKCLRLINGTDAEQYAKLWDYRGELLKRNPNSTIEFDFEQGQPGVFKRMYVCLGGVKSGFKLGCRKVIGLDGTHVKSHYKGQLLCAVGVDPNNSMYPLSYAVVEAEKLETWAWFIDWLIKDLDMDQGYGWTLISDRQKGLINVVEKFLPAAEHRYCVRHLHNNYKQKYRGKSLKDKLWACARAPNTEAFNSAMEFVKAESQGAYDWLVAVPPHHWTRSHFKTDNKCDILLNNMCEAFNRSILIAREQGIIVMLEMIRDYLMLRLQNKREKCVKWDENGFTPKTLKLIEKFKKWTQGCYPAYSGYNQFEVTTVSGLKYAVDLNNLTCACRRWDISGIPCHHAIFCMNKLGLRPEDYVSSCYSVATYKKAYSGIIYPMNGEGLWEKTGFEIKPPKIEKQPGRPKRKRIPDGNDLPAVYEKDGVQILRRKCQPTVRCGICREEGHNRATCPLKETDVAESSTTRTKKTKKKASDANNEQLTGNEAVVNDEIPLPENQNVEIPLHNNHETEMPLTGNGDEEIPSPRNEETENLLPLNGGNANENETLLDVSVRRIQEHKAREKRKKDLSWLQFQFDLRVAREKLEARHAHSTMSEGAESSNTEAQDKNKQTVSESGMRKGSRMLHKKKSPVAQPIRRSQRLVAQTGAESQCLSGFKNTVDSAIVVDDDEDQGGEATTKKEKLKVTRRPASNTKHTKNCAPPNYVGPNVVGPAPPSPLKPMKAKVGGVVIKTKGFIKNGKPVITRTELQKALAVTRKNNEVLQQDGNQGDGNQGGSEAGNE